MNQTKYNKQNGGFTLIEIIVSLAIFTTVAVISVGALLRIMDANRKSISIKTVTNNVNFALESMTREMRVGSKYLIDSNITSSILKDYSPTESATLKDVTISSGNWVVAFNSSKVSTVNGTCNLIYAYRFNGTTLQKAQQSNDCGSAVAITNGDFKDIVSSDVVFTKAVARVDARFKPRIEFLFSGYSGVKDKEKVNFNIQTKVSQRIQ